MDYDQTEKDLKKITDIAVNLPEKYRKASFEMMLKLYGCEKIMELEESRIPAVRKKDAG